MKIAILPVLCLAMCLHSNAAELRMPAEVASLTSEYMKLNEQCRGASGQSPSTHSACLDRDSLYQRIAQKGWCWGPDDAPNYQKDWVKCQASTKSNLAPPAARQANRVNSMTTAEASSTPSASGVKPSDWLPYCSVKSLVYQMSAQYRDTGTSPQDAWDKDLSIDSQWHYVQKDERKTILNRVYFDAELKALRGQALSNAIYTECMNNRPQIFQPVQ